ncbi:hypothetical protein RFI_15701 [Reticulomyxa filosa]|uniref:DUSP domain-containing protein n=1 Tax=Reticulomyxa filosa TaxID=46433 RepID=X6N874_RETFI|nr:hypothetical protein RFI_15701 [Reticulomyxa filosa]|eukprot:ETO21502.1 hypothetical protein RFI_15701 [Reticulomyxa filosa]
MKGQADATTAKTLKKEKKPWHTLISTDDCEECQHEELLQRKQYEKDRIEKLEGSGTTAYAILSMTWVKKWRNWIHSKTDDLPGPLDNTDIVQYIIVPDTIWEFLFQIYGGGPKILANNNGTNSNATSSSSSSSSSQSPKHDDKSEQSQSVPVPTTTTTSPSPANESDPNVHAPPTSDCNVQPSPLPTSAENNPSPTCNEEHIQTN